MKTLFKRKSKTITTIETGEKESFKSINAAKRKSRELQMQNGGLGKGSLVKVA